MPFGSKQNNFIVVAIAAFLIVSMVSSFAAQVLWNTKNIKVSKEQHEQLLKMDIEILNILRHLERRYLDGTSR